MAKKQATPVDCRECVNGGRHGELMVFCSVLNVFRAYGSRNCSMYAKKKRI